jgi:hypothetical protein
VTDDASPTRPTLDLYNLHQTHGLKRELTDVFAASAAICMERHHDSPTTWSVQFDDDASKEYEVAWRAPTDEDRRSYNNDEEATELGARGIALAAVEAHLGLVAYARARPRSGVDFYLCLTVDRDRVSQLNFDIDHQDAVGLEVSGISRDDNRTMLGRVREKVHQIRRGASPDHALACVVGFLTARVIVRTAKP